MIFSKFYLHFPFWISFVYVFVLFTFVVRQSNVRIQSNSQWICDVRNSLRKTYRIRKRLSENNLSEKVVGEKFVGKGFRRKKLSCERESWTILQTTFTIKIQFRQKKWQINCRNMILFKFTNLLYIISDPIYWRTTTPLHGNYKLAILRSFSP